jgi:LmbE family N-acetylglucosaminyl deacetylase
MTVLSPHQDDAGLSLAMTLRAAARQGHPARIVNCFTISAYAPHADAQGITDIGRLRKREDREFAARTGAGIEIVDLGMEDAPLRLKCPVTDVRRRPMDARDWDDAARVALQIRGMASGLVLAPMGLGNHIDHRIAHEAGALLAKAGQPVGFYEDLPYAAELRECCILRAADRAASRCNAALRAFLARDREAAARKRFAIEAYRSQLEASQLDAVIGYGELRGGAERIWMTSGTEELVPAPLETTGLATGPAIAAMRRRLHCAGHQAAGRARAAGRHIAQLTSRGGGVNAPQAT